MYRHTIVLKALKIQLMISAVNKSSHSNHFWRFKIGINLFSIYQQ